MARREAGHPAGHQELDHLLGKGAAFAASQGVSEAEMLGAVKFGFEQMQPVIDLIVDFAEDCAKEPFDFSPPDISAIYGKVKAAGEAQMRAAFAIRDKQERTGAIDAAVDAIKAAMSEEDQADANLGPAIKQLESAVLRGDVVPEGKYAGRRVYNAGINLTHLYYGKIPFLWFLVRDLGFVNKMFRGLARPDVSPDEVAGDSIEKLWISAVETFAIGGGCQILLATDFNIAGRDAYMTLPARKEGIIPAMANLRLSRFVGDRIARQAIMYERRIDCDSDVGRMICDEVVAPADIDATITKVIDRLTGSGAVGAIGNRRALRLSAEPLDLFRRYAALYAREQAYCHFSPALISNLEQYWNAQSRRA